MRKIHVREIERAVRDACIEANLRLPESLKREIRERGESERDPLGREVLLDLLRNADAAEKLSLPICQDTGMAVIFADIGQDVALEGGLLSDAVNAGVRSGYTEGLLRCSVVRDPLFGRENTGDNTPAILHTRIVEGDCIKLTVAPKGFGSENMSAVKMMTPSATPEDIVDFAEKTVREAGSNPCPPVVVGIGIGGDFELAAILAKRALCRAAESANPDPRYAGLEREILARLNATGIGPQGFGGDTTALAVGIEQFPTHIAGLPVAVNIGCHVTRHVRVSI